MKPSNYLLVTAFMFCLYFSLHKISPSKKLKSNDLNKSGYVYSVNPSKINSKYSEIASATFRDKLVIVSSKKIGGLGNGIDPNTQEPFTDLFCSDIDTYQELSQPLLFSRILNTKGNEGQVTFSPDEHTIYYTRSDRQNSLNYKLYKAELQRGSNGNWINHIQLKISSNNYSIENPHVSEDGKYLYFSSNMKGGHGGYDIYKAIINEDGSIGNHQNLGNIINTSVDEKFPHTSKEEKELYFSSKGHNGMGGYDIFISTISKEGFQYPRNLGANINSEKDEIGFLFINDNNGVFSSNNESTNNSFNLYKFNSKVLYQEFAGIIIADDKTIIPNSTVILFNEEGYEIERQTTSKDASYSFKIKAFQTYQIKVLKEGFKNYTLKFNSEETKQNAILKLSSKQSLAKK